MKTDKPEHEEERMVGIKAESLKHYEIAPGMHVIVQRTDRKEGEPEPTHAIEVCFGNFAEKEILREKGSEANGLRHFVEHLIVRGLTTGSGTKRLMEMWPDLHLRQIHFHAQTSQQLVNFGIQTPSDEPYQTCLEFMQRLITGSIFSNVNLLEESMKLDIRRIRNEIMRINVKLIIKNFIERQIYTPDSYNLVSIIGTESNILAASPDQILEMIRKLTQEHPVVISVINPPDKISDEEILEAIPVKDDRPALVGERKVRKNTYNYHNAWVHLEHYAGPRGGEIDTRISIPLKSRDERSTICFEILAELFDGGTTSPMTTFLQSNSKLDLYTYSFIKNRTTNDIQIDASLEASQISDFLFEVLFFFNDVEREREIRIAFNEFKKRMIYRLKSKPLMAEDGVKNLLYEGEYKTTKEIISLVESLTVRDALNLLEEIRKGLDNVRLLTISGYTSKETRAKLQDQTIILKEIVPLIKAVSFDGEEDTEFEFEQK